jgi:Uma2 family endonuclease
VRDFCLRESDRQQKAPLYAKTGIREYWILDVNQRQVYVFRKPNSAFYNQQLILEDDVSINLVAFPEIAVQVSQLFP